MPILIWPQCRPKAYSTSMVVGMWSRRYRLRSSWLVDVEEQRVASAFAVVGDGDLFIGLPAADWEIVGDDPRSLFQARVEDGTQLEIGFGEQVDGNYVGGRIVLLQDIAVNDVRGFVEAELVDSRGAGLNQVGIEFDARGNSAIFPGGHDHDAAIPAAEVEHFFAGFKLDQIEHPFHDALGGRIVRGELFAGGLLSEQRAAKCRHQND